MEALVAQTGELVTDASTLKDSMSTEQVYQTVNFLITTEDAQSLTHALPPGTTIDGLNLPPDAPLVMIQQDEDEDDDEGLENYPADPKLRKTHAKKVKYELACEWTGCSVKGRLLSEDGPTFKCNDLITHVKQHLLDVRDNIQQLLIKDEKLVDGQSEEDEPAFKCLWEDCDFVPVRKFPTISESKTIDLQFEELTRHVFFHVFHSKIKYIGQVVSKKNKLEVCQFNSDSRNLIPELPERIRCEWANCDTAFDNPIMFYTHVIKHVDDLSDSATFKCKWRDCSKTMKLRGHMKEHIRIHTQEKAVGCPQCGGMFASKTKFSDHIVRQKAEAAQIFHCQYCSKKFGLERLLRDHMRQHVNHYKCPLCDMTCAFPANLRHHIQYKHSEYRPHCCPHCPYMAKTQYDLNKHLNNHDLEDTYECDVEGCDYSSVSLECFKNHQRQHDLKEAGIPKRRFQCHVCLKEFTRGTNLTSHLKNNHNVKWPEGLKRFKYVLYEDGFYRLQAVRYESIELTQQLMQSEQNQLSATVDATQTSTEVSDGAELIDSSTVLDNNASEESSAKHPSCASSASESNPATAATIETSGNENLEMLGDVASLLQSPTKKSLPQRKTRGKRKRDDDSPPKKSKRCAADDDHLEHVHNDMASKEEEDDGTLYRLVEVDALSPFANPSVISAHVEDLVFAASTPSTTIGSIGSQSSGGPQSIEPQSSVGPPSIESDATRYHLVPSVQSIPDSVGTPESISLYRLAEGGVGSVGSNNAEDDEEGPPSSVPQSEFEGNFPRTLQQLRTVTIVESPGFLSSPEENVLFRLADSIELPDELAVESPLALIQPQEDFSAERTDGAARASRSK